jgi:capsid protein
MLDAWRTFTMHRDFVGDILCQPIYTMLQEEAYLRGEFDVPDFYTSMPALTRAVWRGTPKGDIEPIKQAQADILLVQNNLKTRAEAIIERGGEITTTFDQLALEQEMMAERNLHEGPVQKVPGETVSAEGAVPPAGNPPDNAAEGADTQPEGGDAQNA